MIWAIVGRSYGFCGNRIEFGINWYADWRASIPFQRRRPTLKHGQGGGLKLAPNSQLVDPELKPLANWAGWQLVDLPPQLTSWMNRCGDCLMGRVWTWYWLLGYPPRRVGPGYMLSQWEHGLQVPKRGGGTCVNRQGSQRDGLDTNNWREEGDWTSSLGKNG